MAAIEMIAVGKLKLADDNVRHAIGDIRELTASIKSMGVIEPLIVREGDYVVVAGARRLAAAKKAGLKEVPAIVRPYTDEERLAVMLVENLQRDDLSPLEEAGGYARLVELGLKQQQIAAKVGRSQGTIAKRLALLTLPAPIRKQVESGKLNLEDAGELAKLKDDPKLVQRVADKNATYGGIAAAVDREMEKKKRAKQVEAEGLKLAKNGETVVKLTGDQWTPKPPKGCKLVLEREPSYYTSTATWLVMDPAEHAKLDCHLVAVNPSTLKPVEVCGQPSNHPDPAEKKKADNDKREAKQAKAQAAFDQITAKRREFVRSLAAPQHGPDKELVLELVHLALFETVGWGYGFDRELIACQIAGIEVPKEEPERPADVEEVAEELEADPDLMEALMTASGRGNGDTPTPDQLLIQQAAKGATDKLRVTFALAASSFELSLGNARYRDAGGYLELLQTKGYTLDNREKQLLSS